MGGQVKGKRWTKKEKLKQLIKQRNAYSRKEQVTLIRPPWEKLYDRPDFIKVKKPRVE